MRTLLNRLWAAEPDGASPAFGVVLVANAAFSVGTNGVSGQLRLYHGRASGTKIDDSGALTMVATDLYNPFLIGFDASPVLPNQTYTRNRRAAISAATTPARQS